MWGNGTLSLEAQVGLCPPSVDLSTSPAGVRVRVLLLLWGQSL